MCLLFMFLLQLETNIFNQGHCQNYILQQKRNMIFLKKNYYLKGKLLQNLIKLNICRLYLQL